MSHHVASIRSYLVIFFALMALTALTVWVATVDLGEASIVVALAIAVTKALLVILYFMHVKHSPALTQTTVAAGFLWLVIMLVLLLSDYFSRGWLPLPAAW